LSELRALRSSARVFQGGCKLLRKIGEVIREPRRLVMYLLGSRVFRGLPDPLFLSMKYRLVVGKALSLHEPTSFNEKLQWLKIHDRRPEYTNMVDKYEARKYIVDRVGSQYLVPLLGVYDTFEEIDFAGLPNQYVLKPTHTSGDVFVCRDSSQVDYAALRREVGIWMRREYYWLHREWPYKDIRPRLICEQLLEDGDSELKDYKLMCFNGKVKCLFVCSGRNSSRGLHVDFFDMEWEPMPFERHYPRSGLAIPRPATFDDMVRIAETLSKGIHFLRVDFYEVNRRAYVGELTFYPGAGFERFTPEYYDYLLGSWLELPSSSV
jgi:hypothetical protein